ncbi:hypothetical protein [Zunongwangia endophytica]|uniref:Uncharacterized protein n=1 Tax=Zunongwangia endophytica TaxID=1808945 RepID=A0ABV8HBK6_9FLAO|nr:hypothetical protein [Zunongwangia endophytica]MDN3594937.1 hypothetical protein [Zunongwangia endophytica]
MKNTDLKLLPHKFKIFGYSILVISIVFFLLNIFDILFIEKELAKNIFWNTLLVALLILAVSKESIEDERTLKLRIIAFASTFLYGVGFIIISPFVNIIFEGRWENDIQAHQLLFTMFLWYFGIFFYTRKFN